MGKATRDAYGETLKRLGSTHPDIVVLDADFLIQVLQKKI